MEQGLVTDGFAGRRIRIDARADQSGHERDAQRQRQACKDSIAMFHDLLRFVNGTFISARADTIDMN
jgi:hypothetical protein